MANEWVAPVLLAAGGGAGIASMLNAVVRSKSGRKVDEANAANEVASGAAVVVQMLRESIAESRADSKEARMRAEQAVASAAEAHRFGEDARRLHERCEDLRVADAKELAQQSAHLGVLSTRLVTLEETLGTLGVAVDDVRTQVTTANSKTLATLADESETRRIEEIPVMERTDAEAEHVTAVPLEEAPG